MSAAGRGWLGLLLLAGSLAPAGLVACGEGLRASEASRPASASVTGTVLDALAGEPLAGVLVEGPREARAVTDLRGRFELAGLRVGDSGRLRASRSDGFRGELPLRPLRAGRLEVVFHLRPARE